MTATKAPTRGISRARAGMRLLAAVVVALVFAAPAYALVYTVPHAAARPEGVAASGATFYVSSFANGAIYRGTRGHAQTQLFLPAGQDGRTAATGVKVDRGRLFVAGGGTGKVWVYDAGSGALLRIFTTGAGGFLNDITVAPDGTAYVTDSHRPDIFRITCHMLDGATGDTVAIRPWIDDYPSFQTGATNANGIVARAADLIYVQSVTGDLFHVDRVTRAVTQISVSDPRPLLNGDGLVVKGARLFVVRRTQNEIDTLALSQQGTHATYSGHVTLPAFHHPTTAAGLFNRRLLVVNSQRAPNGPPNRPFTVLDVKPHA